MSISSILKKKEQQLNELKKLNISNHENISSIINNNLFEKQSDEKEKKMKIILFFNIPQERNTVLN